MIASYKSFNEKNSTSPQLQLNVKKLPNTSFYSQNTKKTSIKLALIIARLFASFQQLDDRRFSIAQYFQKS